jgi:pilus assembly protein CpaC
MKHPKKWGLAALRASAGPAAGGLLLLASSAHATDLTAITGQAVMLPLPRPAARLFIADPGIATASADAGTLYLTGRAAGETSWSASDARGRLIDRGTLQVRYDEAALRTSLATALPGSAISVATARDVLVLSGSVASAAEGDDAMRLAARYVPGGDAKQLLNRMAVASPVQVNIKVRVAEVSRDVLRALGFNWQVLGSFGNATLGLATGRPVIPGPGFPLRSGATDNIFAAFRNGNVDLNLLIDALEDEKLVTILAEPDLTALSGLPASFLAGGEYPIPVPQALGVTTIEYKRFGVSLAFVATVGAGGRITLNVRPEVSQLTFNGGISFDGIEVPALTTRRAETTVELGSGQGFAIAGLLQRGNDDDVRKLPLLGDLPILGPLFRSKRYARRETELVIIVTPSLVRPVAAAGLAVPATSGWVPGAAVAANAAASLANPRDASAPGVLAPPMGDEALAGARRLREGKPLPLPDSGTGATPQTPDGD